MTKSYKQLLRLVDNPFYKLNDEEIAQLKAYEGQDVKRVSSVAEDAKKNKTSRGNAAVKQIGKLEKHPSDPTTKE